METPVKKQEVDETKVPVSFKEMTHALNDGFGVQHKDAPGKVFIRSPRTLISLTQISKNLAGVGLETVEMPAKVLIIQNKVVIGELDNIDKAELAEDGWLVMCTVLVPYKPHTETARPIVEKTEAAPVKGVAHLLVQ